MSDDGTPGELVQKARDAKKAFGPKCGKFAGAVTVEIIRARLQVEGILVSARDVFISGLPIELDLLVPRKGAEPWMGMLYEREDVCAVLEIKNAGSFGDQTIRSVRSNFERVRQRVPGVTCAYVSLEERQGYKWAITDANSGARAFTLAWRKGDSGPYSLTADWSRIQNS